MLVYGNTDTGRVRPTNQDSFRCGYLQDSDDIYAIVCDGMGGASGGDIASRMAAELIERRLISNYRADMSERSIDYVMESAIYAANMNILDRTVETPELRGMGTTAVVVTVIKGKVHVAYVGDSRAYLITEDDIRQITHDHSVVQELIDQGRLTEEDARVHPHRHVITRAVGVGETVDIDFVDFPFPGGARILICTDGLTDMLETAKIYKIARIGSPTESVEALIDEAGNSGGVDNITAIMIA